MIPEIRFDFNFDIILLLIFAAYIIYGYFSGGHKQIRLSINLILPFMLIYYLGRYITKYLYIPLSNTILFEMIDEYMDIFKNTFGMVISYVLMYVILFLGIFLLSIYARRYILNENMRAKLGIKNNYLGALFAFINGYVLIYFIILPVFSMGLVDENAHLTTFVLEHPPPFSRIARTAEQAVPIKGLADKADDFQKLLSVEGIEGYYNDAIYEYQQLYIGDSDSYEEQFMLEVYEELSSEAQLYLQDQYFDYFGENMSKTSYKGISRVLVEEDTSDKLVYQKLIEIEDDFKTEYKTQQDIYAAYLEAQTQYETDVENYEYTSDLEAYNTALEGYIEANNQYLEDKIDAYLNDQPFTQSFTMSLPIFTETEPDNYQEVTTEPTAPVLTQEIEDAYDYVALYKDKVDVTDKISTLGKNFVDHKGLLMWYVDELDREMAATASGGDITEVIISYKNYYPTIIENINDEELEGKLYLAQMSIVSYDVFNLWLECTQENIDTVPIEELHLQENRCSNLDTSTIDDYNFTGDAISLVSTLFEGESVTWIILQYKYDYEDGIFDEHFEDYPEINDVLDQTKGLVDDYDEYYKDIANSIDGNVSMVIKIAISVMKYNFDVYQTLEDTPLLSAMFNDAVRVCSTSEQSPLNINVQVCPKTGDGGGFRELFNMQYLSSEILFKAYIMVDENNEKIIYDSAKMQEFLDKTNDSVENNVITKEVVSEFGDQFAFNVIDETSNYTLLEQMYDDGQISIEAMRLLADDEYELFSEEFRQRVRSLIR